MNPHAYTSSSVEEALASRLPAILPWFGKEGDQTLERLWKEAGKDSETKYILDSAARKNPDIELKELPELTADGIELEQRINGGEYGPRFWIHLGLKEVRFGIEEFHLHSILENSKAESALDSSLLSKDSVKTLSDIWKMAQILGYTVSKKKAKKKR